MSAHYAARGPRRPPSRARIAAADLAAALAAVLKAGILPPCAGSDDWTSDNPAARAFAARECRACPLELRRACARAASERGERFHVWGGKDRTRPKRAAAGSA